MKERIYNLVVLNNNALGVSIHRYILKSNKILQIEDVEKVLDNLEFSLDHIDFAYTEQPVSFYNEENVIVVEE